MQQQETVHIEPDVWIDDDAAAVEDAGARRLEVAVLDRKPYLTIPDVTATQRSTMSWVGI